MKTFAFVALLALASATALPQTSEVESRRDVVQAVHDVINRAIQWMEERGFDPYTLVYFEGKYEFPIAGLFTARGSVSDLSVVGASNIIVYDIGFSLITQKLTFDIGIPDISASLGLAEGEVSFLGRPAHRGLASGRLSIKNFRITGDVSVDISGDNVDISDLVISARLGGIESGIHINIIGYDVSTYVNNFLSNTLPNLLQNNSDYVNRIIKEAIMYFLDRILCTKMKSFAFGLLMLVACAAALPQVSVTDFGAERTDVAGIILRAIEKLKNGIVDRGLDPYEVKSAQGEYVFILPTVFSASARVENLSVLGLSNIVVNSISYSPFSNEFTIDVSMPRITAIVGDSSFEMTVLGREISGSLSGFLEITGLGASGSAKVVVGDEVSISDVKVNAKLGNIQAALNVRILGINLSTLVTNWLNNLPANLSLYSVSVSSLYLDKKAIITSASSDLINRGLAWIIQTLLNHILNKP
ncbi:hypothetical protein RR48_06605 [Papilio machaon]|uniref:Uncharacterized protein n=1 Tax=Papilio machaon TaxID=76193 RepID=A0A194RK41_PAPMA|nr:hypothetical protein RR48_06605 [Papilio machaon]